MGKQCARRVFAVFMVLFLTVGILTFPSDAQEAAYTQLQQRENVTLKRLAELSGSEAVELLESVGIPYSGVYPAGNPTFVEDTAEWALDIMQGGFVTDFYTEDDSGVGYGSTIRANQAMYARDIQNFLIANDPQMEKLYLWQEGAATFSARALCQLPDEECLAALESYGLVWDFSEYINSETAACIAKSTLQQCLDGDFTGYGASSMYGQLELSLRVKLLAMKYDPQVAELYRAALRSQCGSSLGRMAVPGLTRASTGLKDSTAMGSWAEYYENENCYGYALSANNWIDPGYYSGQTCNPTSISDVLNKTLDDFDTRGYWARYTTTKPSTLTYWEKAICVRTGSQGFHFMSCNPINTSSWSHKPGTSVPLRWNYSSPGYKVWTNEGLYSSGYGGGDVTYNSTIYYIIYWRKGGPGPDINNLDPITE